MPLIVIGGHQALESSDGVLSANLYNRLAIYKRNGAEIILFSEDPLEQTYSRHKLRHDQMDPGIFSNILTPRTNETLGKEDMDFWPKLLKRHKRVREQAVLLDRNSESLYNARRCKVKTFRIDDQAFSDESLQKLDHIVLSLNP